MSRASPPALPPRQSLPLALTERTSCKGAAGTVQLRACGNYNCCFCWYLISVHHWNNTFRPGPSSNRVSKPSILRGAQRQAYRIERSPFLSQLSPRPVLSQCTVQIQQTLHDKFHPNLLITKPFQNQKRAKEKGCKDFFSGWGPKVKTELKAMA